jgi:hypothetical protein
MDRAMIIANLATYPPRKAALKQAIERLANQVDTLNVVLNEYNEIPEWNLPPNVNFIIPPTDLKDCGKFYPTIRPDDVVFLVDDDILYPPDYIAKTLDWLLRMPSDRCAVGFHGSLYRVPKSDPTTTILKWLWRTSDRNAIAAERKVFYFRRKLDKPILVDQLGTGTLAIRGQHMPSFEYMRTSQKFVDVRLAKWFFEQGITLVCVPRKENWLVPIEHEETIYNQFTVLAPPHIEREILTFSLKRKNIGRVVKLKTQDENGRLTLDERPSLSSNMSFSSGS